MTSLAAAAALFLGLHILISGTAARGIIVARIGERPYRGLFSLASLGALVWLVWAYGRAERIELWDAGAGARHLALVVMPFAFILLFAAFTTRNPTMVGMEGAAASDKAAGGILAITRHPFLWAVVLWALSHLLANGDGASLVLFGTLLMVALAGPVLIDRKRARADGQSWERFVRLTSNVPFAALLARRTRLSLGQIGWWRIAGGLALYAAALLAHGPVIGVTPLPP